MYPFDTYDAAFQLSALVLTNITTNSTDSIACDEMFNADDDNTVSSGPLQLAIVTSQDLDGFEGNVNIQEVSDDQSVLTEAAGQVSVTLTRKSVIRFFAVVMFISTFLACIY
jgi:hypothetical protein